MNLSKLFTVLAAGALLAACDSGDINIAPETVVSNSNNTTNTGSGGSPDDVCASYQKNGQTVQGLSLIHI